MATDLKTEAEMLALTIGGFGLQGKFGLPGLESGQLRYVARPEAVAAILSALRAVEVRTWREAADTVRSFSEAGIEINNRFYPADITVRTLRDIMTEMRQRVEKIERGEG